MGSLKGYTNLHAISCCQIPMDNPSAGQVLHSLGYLQTHVRQSFLHFTDLKQITSNVIDLDI